MTTEQVHAVAEAMPPRLAALVLVSAGLALRQGEACGLSLDRVDFLRRKVTIDRQMLTVARQQPVHGPVKTVASIRSLPLPDSVEMVLAEHVRLHPPSDGGLLFTTADAQPLSRSRWNTVFKSAATRTGLEATSHDLRHHGASMLISAGCSVKAVQHFLGHATAKETLDTSGHLWPDDEDRIRSAIDSAWNSARGVDVGLGVGTG